MSRRIFSNSDVIGVEVEIPDGHRHIRTTLRLRDGEELVFQEATMANLMRAFLAVKTHPKKRSCLLTGREMGDDDKKDGFADWQLLED